MVFTNRFSAVVLLMLTAMAGAQPSATTSTPATDADAAKLDSFSAIQAHFNQMQEDSQKVIEKQRLVALEAFLPKAAAEEREMVLGTMVGLATGLEHYEQAVKFADSFLKEFATSDYIAVVRRMRVVALMQTSRLAEARKEYEPLLQGLKQEEFSDMFQLGLQLAQGYVAQGDVRSSRQVYQLMLDRLPEVVPAEERAMAAQQIEEQISPYMANLEQIGRAPAALEGELLTGGKLDLAKYKGKVVLLDFWATWCRPCVAAMPDVKAAYRKYHERGFEVVGISLDVQKEALTEFVKRQSLVWPQLWDNQDQPPDTPNPFGGRNSRRYNLKAIPATYLLDREGRIACVNMLPGTLDSVIERVLAGPTTKPAESEAPSNP